MKKLTGHKSHPIPEIYQEILNQIKEDPSSFEKDMYGNGKYLNNFEGKVAKLVGFEAGLFLPSGVMAQLIAIKIWGDKVNSKTFACHHTSHLLLHEEDSYKALLNFEAVEVGNKDSVPTVDDLKRVSPTISSYIHELPMRHLGGDLPSWQELEDMKSHCKESNIKLHIDGARIFETQLYYQKSVKEIVAGADSLFLSFYKGFGSTSGSMLFGDKEFIEEAKIWLRRFGGNLFQLYSLAIPAQLNFDKNINKFSSWTLKAKEISELLKLEFNIETIPYPVKTNMFHAYFPLSKDQLNKNMKESEQMDISMGIWSENEQGHSRIEFSVASATMELTKEEIKQAFTDLLKN